MIKKKITSLLQKRSTWIFFALGTYYLASRLWPLIQFGEAAFGYDLGIYRRIVIDYLSGQPQPAFAFGYLAKGLHAIGFSIDGILYGGYVATTIALGFLFVWYVKKRVGVAEALVAACLLATSVIQFSFYQWHYFRNLLAIVLVLCITLLLKKKSHFIFIPLFALISLHPLTAIPVLLSLGVYAIVQKEERGFVFLHVCMAGVAAVLVNWSEFSRYIAIALQHNGLSLGAAAEFDGQFVSLKSFLIHSILYLPFGLIGFWKYKKKYILWGSLFCISTVLVIAKVLLYKRFFILIDLSLLFFASVYLAELYKKIADMKWRYVAVAAYVACFLWVSLSFVASYSPTISPSILADIRALSQTLPVKSTILSFNSQTAPWLLGFAGDHTIIAPGVFDENKWDRQQWEIFWSTKDVTVRKELLGVYDMSKIYIYSPVFGTEDFFADDPHITQLNTYLWVYQF